MSKVVLPLHRRQILSGSAAALAAAGLGTWTTAARAQAAKPLPAYVDWKNPSALIVHSSNTLETRRGTFGNGLLTPSDKLYVRNNLPAPPASIVANPDAWSLNITGVANPRELTVGHLKSIGIETLVMVLQCSGNGRGFFPSKPSGTPWLVGAAGNVAWTGVPVRAVVAALGGLAPGARFMTGTGGEVLPAGVDPKSVVVERSVPLKALDDAILAWEMNGEPIPLAHGGPLRLVVPGYTGVNSIKYVKHLSFGSTESTAGIMANRYRISPQGQKGSPNHPSVLEMNVKSWIESPLPDSTNLTPGTFQVTGVAFGGNRALKKVEVSVDGGRTWREAKLVGPDLGKYAWRQFALEVNLPAGKHTLASRAYDVDGNLQPRERSENSGGYNNNSWADHSLAVTIA